MQYSSGQIPPGFNIDHPYSIKSLQAGAKNNIQKLIHKATSRINSGSRSPSPSPTIRIPSRLNNTVKLRTISGSRSPSPTPKPSVLNNSNPFSAKSLQAQRERNIKSITNKARPRTNSGSRSPSPKPSPSPSPSRSHSPPVLNNSNPFSAKSLQAQREKRIKTIRNKAMPHNNLGFRSPSVTTGGRTRRSRRRTTKC